MGWVGMGCRADGRGGVAGGRRARAVVGVRWVWVVWSWGVGEVWWVVVGSCAVWGVVGAWVGCVFGGCGWWIVRLRAGEFVSVCKGGEGVTGVWW